MFGSIGPAELILIFVIALLVFGPKKLPEVGRQVGKALRDFKKTSEEIKGRIEEEIEASEIKDIRKDIQSGAEAFKSEIQRAADDATQDQAADGAAAGEATQDHAAAETAKDTNVTEGTESHESGEGPKVS
jgi:TatA/E family protein of Tat protein translocase